MRSSITARLHRTRLAVHLAALGMFLGLTGCAVAIPPARTVDGARSTRDVDTFEYDSPDDTDDDASIYGDHVDDETGVYMGPDYEPTGSTEDESVETPGTDSTWDGDGSEP